MISPSQSYINLILIFFAGPPSLPIHGANWLLLLSNWTYVHKAIENMRCRYKTRILGFYLGAIPTVIACDYESIKEVETRPEFLGRMDTIVARERGLGKLLGKETCIICNKTHVFNLLII